MLYTVTGLGLVAALDPATGDTRWVYDPESYKAGIPNNGGFLQRGLGYWTDGSAERLFVGTADAYLVSIDARTGKPDPAFGTGGRVDLTVGVPDAIRAVNFTARRPLIAGNVVVVGNSITDHVYDRRAPPGIVHAFDARTGKRVWSFNPIPRAGEFGADTWLDHSSEYSGSANVWSSGIYDPELDYVYLPTSTPTNNYYGGHRLGDNLFAESLVCLEAKTGKRVWHFQAVHHGIWDYDFPTHPILGRHHRRWPADQGGHSGQQAGVHLCVRPQNRRAGLADRRASRSRVDRAGRTNLADAALPDQTCAVRSSGDH